MKSLYAAMRVFVVGAALGGLAHAGVLVDRTIPTSANVNGPYAVRSNEAWVTGFFSNPTDPASAYNLVGDDFTPTVSGTANSVTVFEVANNTNPALASPQQEFGPITLYLGTAAAATTTGISAVSSTYDAVRVFYQPGGLDFIDQNGNDFPIYALTFTGLNLALTAGTTYDFAVDALANPGGCTASPFGDPCFLALHGSNAPLAGGVPQDSADGMFTNFTLAGGLATVSGTCDAACQASTVGAASLPGTDIDILVNPEPGTVWGTLAASLLGLALYARKRRTA